MKRIALAVLALSLLAGCGIRGGLERPGPMWGEDAVARREAEEAARNQGRPAPLPPPRTETQSSGDELPGQENGRP